MGPAADTAPWLVPVVVVLVVVAAGLITAAVLATAPATRRRSRGAGADGGRPLAASPPGWHSFDDDDLPGFAEFPPGRPAPGTAPAPAADAVGVDTGRSSSPDAGTRRPAERDRRGPAAAVLVVLGIAGLLAGAAIAGAGGDGRHPSPAGRPGQEGGASPLSAVPAAPSPGQDGAGALAGASVAVDRGGVTARLSFAGIVLEPRAVGATVTYPEVIVTVARDARTALAHVRFPTFNCLTTDPPDDPDAAGCVRSLDEYADLPSPALTVIRRPGNGLEFSGRFPTYTRPNGSAPRYTGRVYELRITAAAQGTRSGSPVPASGELFLAGGRAPSRPGDVSVLRFGD